MDCRRLLARCLAKRHQRRHRANGPDRAGADTRVDVRIGIRDLLEMDGPVIEDTWLRARAGEHGYLSGKDAEAVAGDALIVPVVTGSPNGDLIRDMVDLVTEAYDHRSRKAGTPLPPEAWEALQYALAKLAIGFVSGPGALTSALRRSLLDAPSTLPDGSTRATSPDGTTILRTHGPPPRAQPGG